MAHCRTNRKSKGPRRSEIKTWFASLHWPHLETKWIQTIILKPNTHFALALWKANSARLWINSTEVALCRNNMQQQWQPAEISSSIDFAASSYTTPQDSCKPNWKADSSVPEHGFKTIVENSDQMYFQINYTTLAVFSVHPRVPQERVSSIKTCPQAISKNFPRPWYYIPSRSWLLSWIFI